MAPETGCGARSGSAPAAKSAESRSPGAGSLRRPLAGVHSPPSSSVRTVSWPRVYRGKMKLSRQFTVFGSAIFCVVIFSLYLMLDRGHLDYPKSPRREGSFPQVSTGVGLHEGRRGGPYFPAGSRPLPPAERLRWGRVRPNRRRIRSSSSPGSAACGRR